MAKVLKVILDRGNLGGLDIAYVSEVTEKVIKVVCNELCETYWYRDGGHPRPTERFNTRKLDTSKLEEYVSQNGKVKKADDKSATVVWKGNFKLRVNSRREVVNEKCLPLSKFKTYDEWFAAMDVEVVDLTK